MALINFPTTGLNNGIKTNNPGAFSSTPMTASASANIFTPNEAPLKTVPGTNIPVQNYNPTTSVANNINSVGVKANNPNQNITPASKTLTPAQKAPAAPKTLNTSGLLQALARQKAANGVVGQNGYNEADKGNLDYAQKNGWVAPTATPAPNINPQGLTVKQMSDYGSGRTDINGNPILSSTNANGSVGSTSATTLNPDASTGGALTNLSTGVTGNTPGTVTTNSANKGLLDLGATNPGNSGPANDAYKATLQTIQDLQANYAKQSSQISSGGGDVNWGEGQRGALDQAFNTQMQGLQNLAAAQANALGYQVSGAQTQTNALSSAAGSGNNEQNTLQSGLNAVVGGTTPMAPGYNTPVYTRDKNGNLVLSNPNSSSTPTYTGGFSDAQNQQLSQAQQRIQNGTGSQADINNVNYAKSKGWGVSSSGSNSSAMSQLPQQAQDAINSYATQVKNGSMTRQDAEARLGAYGQAGLNALNEVLGSGFNTNASNASGTTTAVGQQLQAAIPPANQALDALQTAFNALPGIEASGASGLNGLLQNISMQTGIGRTAVSNFQGALQEARSRIDAALTGVIGVDAAGKQSNALLPDNMTPSELPGKIAAAKQYLQNQLNSYKGSGNQNSNQNSGNTVKYNSDGTLQAVSF